MRQANGSSSRRCAKVVRFASGRLLIVEIVDAEKL
jgi:hypothetical protein